MKVYSELTQEEEEEGGGGFMNVCAMTMQRDAFLARFGNRKHNTSLHSQQNKHQACNESRSNCLNTRARPTHPPPHCVSLE